MKRTNALILVLLFAILAAVSWDCWLRATERKERLERTAAETLLTRQQEEIASKEREAWAANLVADAEQAVVIAQIRVSSAATDLDRFKASLAHLDAEKALVEARLVAAGMTPEQAKAEVRAHIRAGPQSSTTKHDDEGAAREPQN